MTLPYGFQVLHLSIQVQGNCYIGQVFFLKAELKEEAQHLLSDKFYASFLQQSADLE